MRKMATIQKISAIESIPDADRICTYLKNIYNTDVSFKCVSNKHLLKSKD